MADDPEDGTEALREAIEQLRDRTQDLVEATGTEDRAGPGGGRRGTPDPGAPTGTAGGDPFRDRRRRPLPKQREETRKASMATGTAQVTGEVGDLREAMRHYREIADEPAPFQEVDPETVDEPAPTGGGPRSLHRPVAKIAAAFAVVLLLSPMGSLVLPTQAFAVTTSAMDPTVPEGSLAVLLEGGEVAVGEVVVYESPQGGERLGRVTRSLDGGTAYRVEADGQPDGPSVVVDGEEIVGVVVTHVPHLGVVWALPTPGTMLVFGVALAGYAAWSLRRVAEDPEASSNERTKEADG